MTYHELVEKVRSAYGNVDAGFVSQHVAFQFNITGEAEGAFYLEIADGKVNVEPYEYYDRDVLVTTSAENLLDIVNGKLDPVKAYLTGKIKAEGNIGKAAFLKELSAKQENVKVESTKSEDAKSESTKFEDTKVQNTKVENTKKHFSAGKNKSKGKNKR